VLLGAAVAAALGVSAATASPKATTVHETMIIVGHTLGQKGSDGLDFADTAQALTRVQDEQCGCRT